MAVSRPATLAIGSLLAVSSAAVWQADSTTSPTSDRYNRSCKSAAETKCFSPLASSNSRKPIPTRLPGLSSPRVRRSRWISLRTDFP